MKKKILNIILGILYYVCGLVGFVFLFSVSSIFGVIPSFSKFLFWICFAILPIIILVLPIIIKKILHKKFYKSILLSCIAVIIYFIIVFIVRVSVFGYLTKFTKQKWNTDSYIHLRYLMLEDLEEKYNFIGMNKEEVIEILGEKSYYDNENGCILYFVESEWLDSHYYCLDYDENNIIIDTYEKFID